MTADTAITITVTNPASGNDPAVTQYDVTVPTGVTGEATATANTAYTFTVDTTNYTLSTVTVGGNAVTPDDNSDGSYTIPGSDVTGAIVITVTANSNGENP